MRDRFDVIIVGGGITGLALAHELTRLGAPRVAIVEKAYTGAGASGRNVGRIRAMQLSEPLARLALAAQRKHHRLSSEIGCNTLFWRAGYAWVLYDEEEVTHMRGVLPMLARHRIPARLHEGSRAGELLPILHGGERPAGIVLGPDAIVHHDAVIYGFRRHLHRSDVTLLERTEVVGIERSAGAISGALVRDAGGIKTLEAPLIVNAAEGWSSQISRMVDLEVPNRQVRHEVLVTEATRPFMGPAITFYRPVEGWFNQTLRGELVAGVSDPDEPDGLNQESSFDFLTRAARTLVRKAPRLGGLQVIRQWAGVYDMTPDRFPIVGEVESVPGFYQANGYSGRGMALAPLLAELLARYIVLQENNEFLEWCNPQRFDGSTPTESSGDYYTPYLASTASETRSAPNE